jgi:hypothetical protein
MANAIHKKRQFVPTESVKVRTVEFDRLDSYVKADDRSRSASNVAVEDESPEQMRARTARLLQTLRIPERAEDVTILGVSSFIGFAVSDPHDGQLETFAKKIGADYAVASFHYEGKYDSVMTVPQTSFSQSYGTMNAYGTGGYAVGQYQGTSTSTTYVPVPVTRDAYSNVAVFVRKIRPGDPYDPMHPLGVVPKK